MSATSPTPRGRDNRLILVLTLVAVALLIGLWRSTPPTTVGTSPSKRPTPALGAAQPLPRPEPIGGRTTATALARAVAAVGAYDDGRRASLDDLPRDVQAHIEPARVLLGTTPAIAAPGLPMKLPDGTVARMMPDPVPRTAVPPTAAPAGGSSVVMREHARAVDGQLVARTLTQTGKVPPPTRGDRVKEILEPDAWMAVPYDPALIAGEPLVLINRSLGEYVLRLDATDYGSVRLNGGLVVPGRFYLMQGTMTIHSDVPVGVIIRPLGVVHGYYEQPVRPPSANG